MLRALVILSLLLGLPPQAKDPVAYNDAIVNEEKKIVLLNFQYLAAGIVENDFDKMESKRLAVLNHLNESIKWVEKLGAFKDDASMQQAAIKYFKTCKQVFELEHKTVNELKTPSISDYSSLKKYFAALSKAEKAIQDEGTQFEKVQLAFARKHGLKINDSKSDLQKSIRGYSRASNHNRDVVLIAFKVLYLYNDFIAALNKDDFAKMETLRNQIIKEASPAIAALNQLPTIGADKALKAKALEMTKYFKQSAGSKFKRLIVLLKKEALTQEQADEANRIMNTMNEESATYINAFNEAQFNYLATYLPKTDE